MEELRVGLINGRHELPVTQFIFDEIKNVFDFDFLRKEISSFLQEFVGICVIQQAQGLNQEDYHDVCCYQGCKKLVVYITGLTCVTAELIRSCALNGVSLTLMHYDRDSNTYMEQVIF